MQNNQPETFERKKDTNPLKLIISVLIAAVLFVADLYFMINQPGNIIILVVITILLLVAIYMALDAVLKSSQQKKLEMNEKYENIFKSEKASYLLLRKSYDDLASMIQEASSDEALDEVINTQKAVAKLIIGRNKENSDALMNSNDNVVDKMFAIEDSVNKMQTELVGKQEEFSLKFNEEVMMQQDKLFIELNNTEASISNHLTAMSEKISGFQEEIERLADQIAAINTNVKVELAAVESPSAVETASASSFDDLNFDEPVESFVEDAILEDTMDILPDELTLEETDTEDLDNELSDSGDVMSSEEIEALLASTLSELEESKSSDDVETDDDLDILPDDLTLESPEEEEPELDLSDPGKMMTAEEIEALIAGTLNSPAEVKEEEKEPSLDDLSFTDSINETIEETILEEEKPPMPDLSDPGKMMSPEDIAALIANM